jgi:hypothetical protein
VARPRLLLAPLLTELEWLIKPRLEEWADVASFDAPGVGCEPPAERFGRDAIATRGLVELDRQGWSSYVLVADTGIAAALRIARARPQAVEAVAFGHARLSDAMDGERAPVNREVHEALGQLLHVDYGNFVRHGLTQLTHGSIGDELAQRMIERVPEEIAKAAWETRLHEPEDYAETLRQLDVPLLFVKHEECLGTTEEGFEDAVAAFPEARTVSVPEAPSVSPAFADALHSFVMSLERSRPRP